MSRDSNGNYTLPAGNPVVTGTTISTTWGNGTLNDLATEMTDSLSRSGKGSMLAILKIFDGAVGAPGLAFGSEPQTGLYRIAAGEIALSIGGTKVLDFTNGRLGYQDGSSGAPSFAFMSDPLSGFYKLNTSQLGLSLGGLVNMAWSLQNITAFGIPTTAVTTLNVSNPSTVAGDSSRAIVTSGASQLGLYAGNVNTTANFILTGAPAGAQVAVRGLGNYPLFFGANNVLAASILPGTAAAGSYPRFQIVDQDGTLFDAGYRGVPPRSFTASISTIVSDSGKMLSHNSGTAHTVTIADDSINYQNGTVIIIYNPTGNGVLTISLGTTPNNLRWAPSGAQGNRSLAADGFCTVTKFSAGGPPGTWVIQGNGLS